MNEDEIDQLPNEHAPDKIEKHSNQAVDEVGQNREKQVLNPEDDIVTQQAHINPNIDERLSVLSPKASDMPVLDNSSEVLKGAAVNDKFQDVAEPNKK